MDNQRVQEGGGGGAIAPIGSLWANIMYYQQSRKNIGRVQGGKELDEGRCARHQLLASSLCAKLLIAHSACGDPREGRYILIGLSWRPKHHGIRAGNRRMSSVTSIILMILLLLIWQVEKRTTGRHEGGEVNGTRVSVLEAKPSGGEKHPQRKSRRISIIWRTPLRLSVRQFTLYLNALINCPTMSNPAKRIARTASRRSSTIPWLKEHQSTLLRLIGASNIAACPGRDHGDVNPSILPSCPTNATPALVDSPETISPAGTLSHNGKSLRVTEVNQDTPREHADVTLPKDVLSRQPCKRLGTRDVVSRIQAYRPQDDDKAMS
ncbi:hypothetical protein VP01_1447g4 [Puccinia sorghi]|uniref:Uncharacterized protein n=1 Tax=Puccinia sorghi TaxID=27349 RepID=A0A0L6VK28_9BASI|nr:hypothetical protein VP01_1447g4 [Puccinia sorghi]